MAFKFEELRVWQKSVELTGFIHEISSKFLKEEWYVLTSQIKRAGDSISLNIAEGSTGQTNPEFKRFTVISIRLGIEVIGGIYLAKRINIISTENFNLLYSETGLLIKPIQAFRKLIQ